MKLTHTIPLIIATACFAITGCNKKSGGTDAGGTPPKAVDEKTAIANFKTDIEGAKKWMESQDKAASADPVKGMEMVGAMVAKFKGIKTDGLPADLKATWGEMTGVMSEFGDLFKGLPKVDPAKPDEAMKAFGELMPKMMAIQAKGEPIAKKLEELGTKYGIDLKKVGPGGK